VTPGAEPVSGLRALAGARLAAARRVMAAPEWPATAAGLLALAAVVEVLIQADPGSDRIAGPALPPALLLAVGSTLPLALARGRLLPAAVAVAVAVVFTVLAGYPLTAAAVAALAAALYLVGRHRSRWAAALLLLPFLLLAAIMVVAPSLSGTKMACSGGTLLGPPGGCTPVELAQPGPACPLPRVATSSIGGRLVCGPPDDPGSRLSAVLLLALAVTATGVGRARRLRGEAVARDASSRAVADSLVEHAARGVRAKIARELHDVVAHHISLIAVQAEAARLTTGGMPTEGAKRLVAIGDTARQALTEMRRLLDVLRDDAGTEMTRQPQPGVAQLVELIDEARDSGPAGVRLIVRGPARPLDPGVELTAYRIVQEALTNARRHAAGAAVDVELRYTPDALLIRIRDNGPGPAARTGRTAGGRAGTASGTGYGLDGMRERAAMVGGTLRAGPAAASGFLVEAVLPAGERG
jgi:signal transduction histidine kinase